ncbi:AAA family ATPase [Bosea sp. NPDC003192]|uniref:AAA family ATPase n=1 Tax=Bosea sp. NPDC003192 TaxID=3390551 RepID=UPI003CFFECC4
MHNRQNERNLLKRKLESGLSIHMPAPRRIGKTWTINRLALDLRAAGWVVVEADVEGMRTPQKFAQDLCARIEGALQAKDRFGAHLTQRLNNLLGGNWGHKPLDALGKVDPIEFVETLIAALDETTDRAAILIDEIAYFFLALAEEVPKEANTFAYRLRALQQRYRNVRWVLTGSIGLETIARRYGLEGAFVNFETFVLEPFTPDEARSYMRDPAVRQQFNHVFDASDADFDHVFAELGWLSPYYLKLIANEVRPSIAGTDSTPPTATRQDFEAALNKLLQPSRNSDFAVWREHLQKNLSKPDQALAKHLLGVLSKAADGETAETLLARATQFKAKTTPRQVKDLLNMLCMDNLIGGTAGRYAFRSGLIRRYWQEYEAD